MGYDDYSYGQVYAAWQAELREQAATDALARRIRREQRVERGGERLRFLPGFLAAASATRRAGTEP